MGTGGPFLGGKARSGRDDDHLVPRLRMRRSYTSSPYQAPSLRVAGHLYFLSHTKVTCLNNWGVLIFMPGTADLFLYFVHFYRQVFHFCFRWVVSYHNLGMWWVLYTADSEYTSKRCECVKCCRSLIHLSFLKRIGWQTDLFSYV
jgi:hypothetical protein